MSHARKHVVAQALDAMHALPEEALQYLSPTSDNNERSIVLVTALRGGNVLEVQYPNGEQILCLLPAKFNKTIWIKRGQYVIIEPFTELMNNKHKNKNTITAKIKGRVVFILLNDHVKQFKKLGKWPAEWTEKAAEAPSPREEAGTSDDSDTDDDEYLVNSNHITIQQDDESSDDDDSSDEEDEESVEESDEESDEGAEKERETESESDSD
eukprot:TRINITY_DN6857_c0_g1_i1.p1 TRINITY_DN6857_c0_g1~~TRINITY_DN6857_c0_g1_i1.p1  ORF type:complete len:211 (-),score=60.69 TRINITY_DN6857_c0_g1_i1:178-810(-)